GSLVHRDWFERPARRHRRSAIASVSLPLAQFGTSQSRARSHAVVRDTLSACQSRASSSRPCRSTRRGRTPSEAAIQNQRAYRNPAKKLDTLHAQFISELRRFGRITIANENAESLNRAFRTSYPT